VLPTTNTHPLLEARPWSCRHTVLFHVVTIFVALITTSAYQYFKATGSALDSDFILISLSSPEGLGAVIASEVTPNLLVLILGPLDCPTGTVQRPLAVSPEQALPRGG